MSEPNRINGCTTSPVIDEAKYQKNLARIRARGNSGPANTLEPDRNQQVEFFMADLVEYAIKDDQATMEAPVYSLSTKKDMKPWRWTSRDGKKSVEVMPGGYGRATQHDKDVLIYCTSQLVGAQNSGRKTSRTVRFTAHNFFLATRRQVDKDSYERFSKTLNRLKGTQITTNIVTGNSRAAKGFGLIDSWAIVEKTFANGVVRMVAVEVTISEWLFNAIRDSEVLTINRDYFLLRKPLERRLYEIARKHVGRQGLWEIGIEALRHKCGSTVGRLRQFHAALEQVIEADSLPDYRFTLTPAGKAHFYTRDAQQLAERILKAKSEKCRSVDKSK